MALDSRHGGIFDQDPRHSGLAGADSGPVTVTPAPASAIGRTVNPAVILGAVTVVPNPAAAIGRTSAAVILGAVTVVPAAATAIGKTNTPVVAPGGLIVTPNPARAIARTANPSVVLGPVTVIPDSAVAFGNVVNPSVTLGPVTVVPAAAVAIGRTFDPYIPGDPITVTPAPASAIGRTINPTAILGPVTVVPGAARVIGRTNQPNIDGGLIIPEPARVVGRTSIPVIVPPRLYGAIYLVMSLVTERTRSSELSITEKTSRRIKVELFDEAARPVDGFAITQALFKLVDKTSGTVIRGGTTGENIMSLFDATGKAEILLTANDNRILTTHPRRQSEIHIASFDITVRSRFDSLDLKREVLIKILNLRTVT